MESAYDGRQVVGMDLRMAEDGRRLGTARIVNSPAGLRREIAKAGRSPAVVLEATYGWYWAADALAAAGAEVHLAHPLGVKAFTYRRVKNDEKDAADLADLLRMGRLPDAWIAPPEIRELRELTRYRVKLARAAAPARSRCTRCWPSWAFRSRARICDVLSSRILVRPSNLGHSRRFYRDILGLAIYRGFGPPGDPGVVFFLGPGLLQVSGHQAGPAGHAMMIWIQVRDVHAEHARLAWPQSPSSGNPQPSPGA
jgi:hypothetical protein